MRFCCQSLSSREMFDIFKKLFGRPRARPPVVEPPVAEPSEPIPMPLATPELSASSPSDLAPPAEAEAAVEATAMAARPDTLLLPIRLVVPRLPDSVRMKANLVGASNASIGLPLASVLQQLPSGAVTISFDELRQACPAQTFANVSSSERFSIELPLEEILSRVEPSLL